MVTRERADDRRFGLGKSLDPVLEVLGREGVEIHYLCQEDAGIHGRHVLMRLQGLLVRSLAWAMGHAEFDALVGGILERLNMGRLAAKVAFERQVTHVHCHDPLIAAGFQWFRWYYGGRKAARFRHGLTQHGFGSYTQALHEDGARLDHRLMSWLRRWEVRILQQADWVVLPTRASRDQLARDLACYPVPGHWHVIPHPRPNLETVDHHHARRLLGWEDGWFVVLGVGRNAPLKRFADLIRACACLNHENLHLVLLGPGEDPQLRRLAQEAGLPAHRLHLDAQPDAGIHYSGSDVYVSTSTTESFGLANLEALQAGLPVLATAVGGVPEVVGSGGWLLPACHPTVLAEAIEILLHDPNQRMAHSQRARAWVNRWPDASRIASQYLALYRGDAVEEGVHLFPPLVLKGGNKGTLPLSLYPVPKPLDLPSDVRVLVFAPHPDDETLGVGGMLAGLRVRGSPVKVVVVTHGEKGDPEHKFQEPAKTIRLQEIRRALAVLNIEEYAQWDFPDGDCHDGEGLRSRMEKEIASFRPDWLLVPAPLEIHRDHVAVAQAATVAWLRLTPGCKLFYYEVSQPIPATHVVDVTPWRDTKLKALDCYRLPLSYCDYVGMNEALMRYRAECLLPGASSVEALLEVPPEDATSLMRAMCLLRQRLESICETNGSQSYAL